MTPMTLNVRASVRANIAEDERKLAWANAQIEPDVDCSSVEDYIAVLQDQVNRQRALLAAA